MTAYIVFGTIWLTVVVIGVMFWVPLLLYSFHWWFG